LHNTQEFRYDRSQRRCNTKEEQVIDPNETKIRSPHRDTRYRTGKLRGKPRDDVIEDGRVSVEVVDSRYPWPIRLYFESLEPDSPLLGLELGGEDNTSVIASDQAVRVVASLGAYVDYAHGEIHADRGEMGRALALFREVGTTRRGLPGRHFRIIWDEFNARVEAGEMAPITTMARAHNVHKSTMSRWVTVARRMYESKEGTDGQ
jgi:hypothetical protein